MSNGARKILRNKLKRFAPKCAQKGCRKVSMYLVAASAGQPWVPMCKRHAAETHTNSRKPDSPGIALIRHLEIRFHEPTDATPPTGNEGTTP